MNGMKRIPVGKSGTTESNGNWELGIGDLNLVLILVCFVCLGLITLFFLRVK